MTVFLVDGLPNVPGRLPEVRHDDVAILATASWRGKQTEETRRRLVAYERALVPASQKYHMSTRKLHDLQAHHYSTIGQMNKEFHKRDMAVKILKSKSRRFDVELKQKTELQEAIARIKGEFAERMERQRAKIHRESDKIERLRSAMSVQQQQLELLGGGAGHSGGVPASYFPPRRSGHEQHLPVDLGKDGDSSESEEEGEGREEQERGWDWSSQRGGGGVWEEDTDGRETPDFLEARGMREKESFLANVRSREELLDVLRREGAAHLMHRLLTRFNVDSCEGFCSLKAAEIENALIPHSEKRKLLESQLAVRSLASCSHGRSLSSLVTPRGKLSSLEKAGAGAGAAGATTAAPIMPGWFSQLYKHRNIHRHFSVQVETSELLSNLKAARSQQIWSSLERDGAAIFAAGADKDGFTLLHRVCALPAQVLRRYKSRPPHVAEPPQAKARPGKLAAGSRSRHGSFSRAAQNPDINMPASPMGSSLSRGGGRDYPASQRDDLDTAPASPTRQQSPLSQSSNRASYQGEEVSPCESPLAHARGAASITSIKRTLSDSPLSPISAVGENDLIYQASAARLSSPEQGNSSADGLNYDVADATRYTRGGAAIVGDLVACGAEVDLANKYGRTALHYAAMEGSEGACSALLRAGANASIKDKDGKMPYEFAGLMRRGGWKECQVMLRGAVPPHLLPPPPAKDEKGAKGKKKKK